MNESEGIMCYLLFIMNLCSICGDLLDDANYYHYE